MQDPYKVHNFKSNFLHFVPIFIVKLLSVFLKCMFQLFALLSMNTHSNFDALLQICKTVHPHTNFYNVNYCM